MTTKYNVYGPNTNNLGQRTTKLWATNNRKEPTESIHKVYSRIHRNKGASSTRRTIVAFWHHRSKCHSMIISVRKSPSKIIAESLRASLRRGRYPTALRQKRGGIGKHKLISSLGKLGNNCHLNMYFSFIFSQSSPVDTFEICSTPTSNPSYSSVL